MSWLRIDDSFLTNRKIVELSDKELRIWLRLLCHCARVSDPTVDQKTVQEVAGLTAARVTMFARLELLDTLAPGLHEVHDWLKYLPRDATGAERQARWRARHHLHQRDFGHTSTVTREVTPGGTSASRTRSRARAAEPVPVPVKLDQDQTLSPTSSTGGKNGSQEADNVREVFEHWRTSREHPKAKLGEDRKRKIRGRLREGFTVKELCLAIDAVRLDPWEERERHDDLVIILRDGSQVEKFLELHGDLTVLSVEERRERHLASLREKGLIQ